MRKHTLAFCLLLCIPLLKSCTPTNPRFLGLDWLTPKAIVIARFEEEIAFDSAVHKKEEPSESYVQYFNFSLYDVEFREAALIFTDDKFVGFNLHTQLQSVSALDSIFHRLEAKLTELHGPPNKTACRNQQDIAIERSARWIYPPGTRGRDFFSLDIEYSPALEWWGYYGRSNAFRESGMFTPGESETTPCR